MNSTVSTVATPQEVACVGSEQSYMQLEPGPSIQIMGVFSSRGSQTVAQEYIRALSERLCEEHPSISTYEGVFGGIPHLKGLRISVADVLEQLYLTGSISAVQAIYSPDVSEEQIKEALAYAQDFVETVFCPSLEVDG
jgi:uncharacterized protein (DUF433 family)